MTPLCPGKSRHPWGDCLGKELRVLEHARRVAAVARSRGRRGGRVAALELEHRTEHRRKSQERLRELHRCNKHTKSREFASSRGELEVPGSDASDPCDDLP